MEAVAGARIRFAGTRAAAWITSVWVETAKTPPAKTAKTPGTEVSPGQRRK